MKQSGLFTDAVFEGGGVKGICMAGASAGVITAGLIAGYTKDELRQAGISISGTAFLAQDG